MIDAIQLLTLAAVLAAFHTGATLLGESLAADIAREYSRHD